MIHIDGCARPARVAWFGISIAELWRILRFGTNGLFNTAFNYVLFVVMLELGFAVFPSLSAAFGVTLLINFQTSRRLVFRSKRRGVMARFFLVYIVLFALNYVALLGLAACAVPSWIAQGIVALPIAALAYLAQRNLISPGQPTMNSLSANVVDAGPIEHGTSIGARLNVRVTNASILSIGSAIILLPNLLFAAHLRPLPAASIVVGTLGFALLQRRPCQASSAILGRPVHLLRLAVCLVLSIALLILGGEAHLFFTNWDWLWRDAVLADLVRGPFPPTYQVGGETWFLRAPLGMYMLPAFIGQATHLGLAHVALLAQNSIFLALILYMLAAIAGPRAWLIVPIFLGFSGLDALGELIMWLKGGHGLFSFQLPSHIDSWVGLQYSSSIGQLFWVPNHALPGFWLAILAVLCARRELALADLGIVMAATLFWTPFAVIGTLPFAVYLLWQAPRATLVSPRFWAALGVALCFLPVAFYMKIDAAKVPYGIFLLQPNAAFTIALFLMIELASLTIIKEVWADLDPWLRGILGVAIVVLIVLPIFQMGEANDLVMRASIPALTILSIAFGESLAHAWRGRRFKLLGAGVMLAIVGAITPAQELIRSLSFSAFATSNCNLVTVWQKLSTDPTLDNYLARREKLPSALMKVAPGTPLSDQPSTVCWPGIPYDPRTDIGALSVAAIKQSTAIHGNGAQ